MSDLFYQILKAKRRQIGETWTRPSGVTVKKVAKDKIIPVPKGREKKKQETPVKKASKKPPENKKPNKPVATGFASRFSKYLDIIKKVAGFGTDKEIEDKIQTEFEKAKESGIHASDQKFLHSYFEYFSNKGKWDRLFSQKNRDRLKAFGSPAFFKVAEIVRKRKERKSRPYDKKSLRYLYNQYGDKSPGALEVGQPIHLDREIRFGEYKIGNTKIYTGREDQTQLPTVNYLSGAIQNSLSPHQQDGSNLCLEKFHSGEKGFVIADGTGGGKTRQALAIADSYLKTINAEKPIVIVTESDNILNTAWMNDAQAMGLEINNAKINGFIPGKINITTYSQAEKLSKNTDLGLLIFDESHNLKNEDSNQTKLCMKAVGNSSHVLNCSATPIETPEHLGYLATSLGLDAERLIDFVNGPRSSTAYDKAMRLDSVFSDLTKKGLMVKREVSLSNLELNIKKVDLAKADQDEIQRLERQYKENRGGATELMMLRRVLEEKKVNHAIDHLKSELAEGRQVVLFADRISDTTLYGHTSAGTLPLIEKKLKELGIEFESVYGGTSSEKERMEVRNKVGRFQSGQTKVILGNPESMGTGISLDDTTGLSPRTLISLTPPFSAMTFLQKIGRVNRLTTKSRSRAIMLSSNNYADTWGLGILQNKAVTLGASVKGDYETIDLGKGGSPTVGKSAPPPPIDTSKFKKPSENPPASNSTDPKSEEEVGKSSFLLSFLQILKGKKLPVGHVSTRKDGNYQKLDNGKWKRISSNSPKSTDPKSSKKSSPKGGKEAKAIMDSIDSKFLDHLPTMHKEYVLDRLNGVYGEAKESRQKYLESEFADAKRDLIRSIAWFKDADWQKVTGEKNSQNYRFFSKLKNAMTEANKSFDVKENTLPSELIQNFLSGSEYKEIVSTEKKSQKDEIKKARQSVKKAKTKKSTDPKSKENKFLVDLKLDEDLNDHGTLNPSEKVMSQIMAGGRSGENSLMQYGMNLFYNSNGTHKGIVKNYVFSKDEDHVNDLIQDTLMSSLENLRKGVFAGLNAKQIKQYFLSTLKFKAIRSSEKIHPDEYDDTYVKDPNSNKPLEEILKKEEEIRKDQERIKQIEAIETTIKEIKGRNKLRNAQIWRIYEGQKKTGDVSYLKIALKMGVTPETIKQQIKNMKRKMMGNYGTRSTAKSK
ncbi:DEAD/DEAH box helicase family protein [Leptospira levettii]|uniref:DEAD/DEAH box helicase family protein n=1 Tax=Leptospira levettii TaxID=2023178 RepID=UPI000C2AB847|nr:DEAD/DEAH box helicase family protein [Leptospira levettii]PJZ89544.1 hypothetical protein CH368_06190 [Leptospira levettii]